MNATFRPKMYEHGQPICHFKYFFSGRTETKWRLSDMDVERFISLVYEKRSL